MFYHALLFLFFVPFILGSERKKKKVIKNTSSPPIAKSIYNKRKTRRDIFGLPTATPIKFQLLLSDSLEKSIPELGMIDGDNDKKVENKNNLLKDSLSNRLSRVFKSKDKSLALSLYEKVMNQLKKFKHEKKIPNLNKRNFSSKLFRALSSSKDPETLKKKSFWNDVSLLVYEWLYNFMEPILGDDEFEKLLKHVKKIIQKIYKKYPDSRSNFDLASKSDGYENLSLDMESLSMPLAPRSRTEEKIEENKVKEKRENSEYEAIIISPGKVILSLNNSSDQTGMEKAELFERQDTFKEKLIKQFVCNLKVKRSIRPSFTVKRKRTESSPCHYDPYFGEIFTTLKSKSMSKNNIQIVLEYSKDEKNKLYKSDKDRLLIEFYEIIMEKLTAITKEEIKEKVDPYSYAFASQLLPLITFVKSEIHLNDPFWNDLVRLLFKWAIYLDHVTNFSLIEERMEFEDSVKDIELILNLIHERKGSLSLLSIYSLDHSKLSLLSQESDFAIFESLIKYELLEDHDVWSLFTRIRKSFYHDSSDEIDKNEKSEKLKTPLMIATTNSNSNSNSSSSSSSSSKANEKKKRRKLFFSKENLDNNMILRLVIRTHDPLGEIRAHYSLKDDDESRLNPSKGKEKEKEKENINLFDKIISEEFPRNLDIEQIKQLELLNVRYLSSSIMELFLENDLSFIISNFFDLTILLRKLEKAGLLTRKPIHQMIKFEFPTDNGDDCYYKWDKGKFKGYLKESESEKTIGGQDGVTKSEYERYIELPSE